MPIFAHVLRIISLPFFAISVAHGGQLRVQPERLDLTGPNPNHGLLVTLVGDDGSPGSAVFRGNFPAAIERFP